MENTEVEVWKYSRGDVYYLALQDYTCGCGNGALSLPRSEMVKLVQGLKDTLADGEERNLVLQQYTYREIEKMDHA